MHLQVLGSTRWFCFDQLQSGIGPASWTNSHSWAQVTLSQRSLGGGGTFAGFGSVDTPAVKGTFAIS